MSRARRIEEASLNAWPALNFLFYDGWLLRFADGYTKRANSVTPLYESELDTDGRVEFCEDLYRQQNLPPIFRLPSIIDLDALDSELARRAYRQVDRTSVQGRALSGKEFAMSARTNRLTGRDGLSAWLQTFHALSPGRRDMETHEAILRRIIGTLCPLVLQQDGDVIACGLGVLQGAYLGLFDIVTAQSQRRKGYGRELTESVLAWGKSRGAHYAYLQVMASNSPAQALYSQLGFSEQYQYWYRVAPTA